MYQTNPVIYKASQKEIYDEQGIKHTVYGVSLYIKARTTHDVFTDKKKADNFVNLCNQLQLDPIHLDDVIQDAII